MAITRFLRVLEVRPIEGDNSAAVEPFDARHARPRPGRAGPRPGPAPRPGRARRRPRFLERAVKELAGPDGRVIPVRLTLLAEMLRHRDWTTATLRELGGFEGIGVMFLEETFSAPTAPPSHRMHQRAAQAVLKALLPEPSSDLKGRMRPGSALREAAGYADRPADFAELMALLDNELRMVTPVDPSAVEVGGDRDAGLAPRTPRGETVLPAHARLPGAAGAPVADAEAAGDAARAGRAAAGGDHRVLARPPRASPAAVPPRMAEDRRAHQPPRLVGGRAADDAGGDAALSPPGRGGRADRGGPGLLGRRRAPRSRAGRVPARPGRWSPDYTTCRRSSPSSTRYRDAHRPKLEALETDEKASEHHRRGRRDAALPRPADAGPRRGLARPADRREPSPSEVAVIRDALAAHPEQAGVDELRRVLRDEAAEPAARLRAACVLAALEPGFAAGRTRRPRPPGWPKRCWPSIAGRSPAGSSCSARPPGWSRPRPRSAAIRPRSSPAAAPRPCRCSGTAPRRRADAGSPRPRRGVRVSSASRAASLAEALDFLHAVAGRAPSMIRQIEVGQG